MKHFHYFLIFGLLLSVQVTFAQADTTQILIDTMMTDTMEETIVEMEIPTLGKIKEQLYIRFSNKGEQSYLELYTPCSDALLNGKTTLKINGEAVEVIFKDCQTSIPYEIGSGKLILISKGSAYEDYRLIHIAPQKSIKTPYQIKYIPLWVSIVPLLVVLFLLLLFKDMITALFMGIWSGAFIANGMRLDMMTIVENFVTVIQHYILETVADKGHLSIIAFLLMMGGMFAIISKNGGISGLVEKLSRYATTPRSVQLITWLLGFAIFFDNYTNRLIVGKTMRPLTDKLKVSREKLAYLVDSTAASVTAIAFISTWIVMELSYIKDNMHDLTGLEIVPSAYSIFLATLQYAFYPILTLCFVLLLILTRRDFGAMRRAEKRARTTGEVLKYQKETRLETDDLTPVKEERLRSYNAVMPMMTVILMMIVGLVVTGFESILAILIEKGYTGSDSIDSIWFNLDLLKESERIGIFERVGFILGNADIYTSLIWASLSGLVLSIFLTVISRIMKVRNTMNTLLIGFKTVVPTLMILVLAWSLGTLSTELNTASFLASLVQDTFSPIWMPLSIFIIAALIAFSTGSNWSTMAIVYPIAIPTTWAICMANGYEPSEALSILYNVIATVLAASVFGNHCSPVSYTTILSSLASDCNHLDHLRTQLPYAITVGLVSVALGYFSIIFPLPTIANFAIGIFILFLIIRVFGRVVE